MKNFFLDRKNCALIIIDIQDRLFGHVERSAEMLLNIEKLVEGMKILEIPIIISEQIPEKMGQTVLSLKEKLSSGDYKYFSKSTFSCYGSDEIRNYVKSLNLHQFILVGIEAHVCVLQTAKSMLEEGLEVVVLNDAISSRSIFDYSTAISEMKDLGIRVSSVETILFELVSDSKAKEFKSISQLIK